MSPVKIVYELVHFFKIRKLNIEFPIVQKISFAIIGAKGRNQLFRKLSYQLGSILSTFLTMLFFLNNSSPNVPISYYCYQSSSCVCLMSAVFYDIANIIQYSFPCYRQIVQFFYIFLHTSFHN